MNWVITTTWGDSPFRYVYKEKTKKKANAGKKQHRLTSHWKKNPSCEGLSCSSIPYYPSCSEERTQLGSGYWIFATPLNKLIKRGTGRHPRFNTNL